MTSLIMPICCVALMNLGEIPFLGHTKFQSAIGLDGPIHIDIDLLSLKDLYI